MTPTQTPSQTQTPTQSSTPTQTPTITQTSTQTLTPTRTVTPTMTPTVTSTVTPTITPTFTQTPTSSPIPPPEILIGQIGTFFGPFTGSSVSACQALTGPNGWRSGTAVPLFSYGVYFDGENVGDYAYVDYTFTTIDTNLNGFWIKNNTPIVTSNVWEFVNGQIVQKNVCGS